ncbi:MAG: hypothetical protein AAFX65_01460 [Cyanobacteria bacterium J06638_7]
MARPHWLDPLARQLLILSGQLPAAARRTGPGPRQPTAPPTADQPDPHQEQIERELLLLKLRQDPQRRLASAEEVRHAAALGWRLDVNRAGAADWSRLPGITDEQVDLLMRLQAGGVQLSGAEDLQRLLDMPARQLQGWLPVLRFRWYGQPVQSASAVQRLDLNRAGAAQLDQLGLTEERRQRLLVERARRPFRDLADLQGRLQLPPDLVEAWIGRVCFSDGKAGPVLPPAPRSA